jgi:hypothetical protein
MLSAEQKSRIHLYNPKDRAREKAERRLSDALDVANGKLEEVEERNRVLPHASQFEFPRHEKALPIG